MSEIGVRQAILEHIRTGGHVTLFLDYDGTLVPIAPTPAEARSDQGLLHLLTRLSEHPSIRILMLSGRSLDSLRSLLPISHLILGGLYGIEMQMDGKKILRGPPLDETRRSIVDLSRSWARLIDGLAGFLLEDKGQALALHARWADAEPASHILTEARKLALELVHSGPFRILEGDRFLELAPKEADKGKTAEWLLTQYPIERDLPVSFGDDNKDEGVFAAVQRRGGFAIGVGDRYALPGVDARLQSPQQVREWLESFVE